jgi:DNA gyrase subunit A
MKSFSLSEVQANAILDMQLRRLAALERRKVEEEYAEILKEIARLEDLLANPQKILGMIKDDLTELRDKYGDERRTRIVDATGDLSDEDLIPEVDVIVTLTQRGYIKRLPDGTYRTQHRGGRGVTGVRMTEKDGVQHLISTNTHDSLLFFTDRGRVFQMKAHEIPDASRTAKGLPVVNLIDVNPNESITTVLPIREFDSDKFLFMCTRKGRVKRTDLSAFATVRKNGLIAVSLDEDDELAWVRVTSGNDEIILVTEQAKSIRFLEPDVRPMGRPAAGVIGIRMADDDRIVAADVISDENKDHQLMVISDNGFGKRTNLSEFRIQGRGGQGITAMKLTGRNGRVAGAYIVNDNQEVIMISSAGVIIRISTGQISCYGRSTQGVSVMRLPAEARVVSIAVVSESLGAEQDLGEVMIELDAQESADETPTNGKRASKKRKS